MEQHPLGRIDPQAGEQLGIAQRQLDHLAQLADRIAHPPDVVIVDLAPAGAGFLELLAKFDLGVFVDMDDALRHGRNHGQADLGQGKGRRVEHPRHFGRHIAHLLLAGGGDDVARDQRPTEEVALQRLAWALQSHFTLGRSEHHPRRRFAFCPADLDMIARPRLGIAALQTVEPDHFQTVVFGICRLDPRRGDPLALDLDHVALGHAEGREGRLGQPGEAIAAFLLPRRGNLELD